MGVLRSLTFDSENSLNYGVYITGEAVYNAPERVVEMISVPGRNGEIAFDQGRFENIEVTYPAGTFADSQSDFADKVATFRNILCSRFGYKRLTDEYHTDEFRLAVYKSGLEVDPVNYQIAGEFEITFNCKPQRFLTSGEVAQTFTAAGTITNPTAFDAKPLITVTGYGVLGIGDYSLTVQGTSASQVINIDCDTMEAWEVVGGAMVSRNDHIQNAGEEFPVLVPGSNGVSLGANMSKVEITPRWWRI